MLGGSWKGSQNTGRSNHITAWICRSHHLQLSSNRKAKCKAEDAVGTWCVLLSGRSTGFCSPLGKQCASLGLDTRFPPWHKSVSKRVVQTDQTQRLKNNWTRERAVVWSDNARADNTEKEKQSPATWVTGKSTSRKEFLGKLSGLYTSMAYPEPARRSESSDLPCTYCKAWASSGRKDEFKRAEQESDTATVMQRGHFAFKPCQLPFVSDAFSVGGSYSQLRLESPWENKQLAEARQSL